MYLVLGGSGELGGCVCAELGRRKLPYIATYSSGSTSPIANAVCLNLREDDSADKLSSILLDHAVSVVIHCAIVKHGANEDMDIVRDFVVCRTMAVAKACQSMNVRLLMMSTDLVFDGLEAPYCESSTPTPLMPYGRFKVEMEKQLLDLKYDNLAILRTSLILTIEESLTELLGTNSKRSKCMHFCMSRSLEAFEKGEAASFFTDEIRSVTCGHDLASALVDLGQLDSNVFKNEIKLLHLVAPKSTSRLGLAQAIVDFFKDQLDKRDIRLVGSLSKELFKGTRPLDCTFDSSLYETLAKKHNLTPLRPALEVLSAWNK